MEHCARCGEGDIPADTWFWFESGRPIHPWCDWQEWDRLPGHVRALIQQLAETCRDDPRRARAMSLGGSSR